MRSLLVSGLLIMSFCAYAQISSSISESEVARIEKILSADDLRGRKVFTPDIEKAASFISDEFTRAGLKPLHGNKNFRQSFTMVTPEDAGSTISLNGVSVDAKNLVVFSAAPSLTITENEHYKKVFVKKALDFMPTLIKYLDVNENILILVDTSLALKFGKLSHFHLPQFEGCGNRIFILTSSDPMRYNIQIRQSVKKQVLTNMVGIIPGKSKPNEFVIFSAHYDHLGVGNPDATGDSIYNGANDDASGTTAVIMLAKYFSKLHNNERTLVFAAFTAEEIGEFGSTYFSKKVDTASIKAMLNIEMIGTESKWGKNSAYVTGYDETDLGAILQKNLISSHFKFYPDPYPEQLLFLRSDNAALAKKGIPAITISTSKMDSEKYYHKQGDEVGTLDLENMTEIIQSIGLSAGSVISGKDYPGHVHIE